MILWRTDLLAAALKREAISERQYFYYFLIGTMIVLIQVQWVAMTGGAAFSVTNILHMSLQVLLTGALSVWLYEANGGDGGKRFVTRYICLAVPVNIQIILAKMMIYILYLGFLGAAKNARAPELAVASLQTAYGVLGLVFYLAFFFILRRHIRFIVSEENEGARDRYTL